MNRPKKILLDLDGTLTDPKEGITKSIQYALNEMNRSSPTEDELEWCIGPPLREIFVTLLGTQEANVVDRAIEHYRDRYVGICEIENVPYKGIEATLGELNNAGHQLYLATSKPWVYAGKILDHFDLTRYFTAVHGSELDGTRDYKHDLIAYVLEQHGLDPTHCTMIGDRSHDVIGAKHNGVSAVGVTYGYGSLEELTEAGADHLCHSHEELKDMGWIKKP